MFCKRSILTWLVILAWILPLSSQSIFREGYIIKKSGEVYYGLVEYSSSGKNPVYCNFKRFDIALPVKYSPSDISVFGYNNGKRFETRIIGNREVFLEMLVMGNFNLLRGSSKYYLESGNQNITEISSGNISWGENDFNSPLEFFIYLAKDLPITIPEKLNLKNDLVPLVIDLNKSTGSALIVYGGDLSEKELSLQAWKSGAYKNRFGALAGVNIYLMTLEWPKSTYYPVPERETGPMVGITYERIISGKSDNLALRVDLALLSQNFYSYEENIDTYGLFEVDEAFYDFIALKIPLLLQYSFTGRRIIPFVNGGFSGQFLLTQNYLHRNEEESFSHEIYTTEDQIIIFNPKEIGPVIGAGARFRTINKLQISLQGRLEFGYGILNMAQKRIPDQSSLQLTFLLGISF